MAKTKKIDKEKTHEDLWLDLLTVTEEAQELGVPHIVYVGIQFFTQMALDCAPDEQEAYGMILTAIKDTKKSKEDKA